jgi:hypothetical protein
MSDSRAKSSNKANQPLDDKEDDLADMQMESDAFYKKWAAPVLLGPFIPAIFAFFIIVVGQLKLNTATGSCGYNLECKIFVSFLVNH